MIIFFEDGRLGNQLFQYCAMRKFQPKGVIFAVGMNDLVAGFSGIELLRCTQCENLPRHLFYRISRKLIELGALKFRLISTVREVRSSTGVSFKFEPGLFRKMIYFKGYFQTEDILEESILNEITIKDEYLGRAKIALKNLPGTLGDRFFVHIRRGDYLHWPSSEAPAALPLSWYKEQMNYITEKNHNAVFVVVSDEPSYISDFFAQSSNVFVMNNEMILDFAIMSQCHGGGILSASSFSWWGAYFAKRENPQGLFIAPKYWVGHRRDAWYPEGVQTSWLSYVPA
jgi:hypothetical protein